MLQQLWQIKKQMKIKILFLGWILMVLGLVAQAYAPEKPLALDATNDGYEITLSAQSKAPDVRKTLFQMGLKQVLQNLAGDAQVLQNNAMVEAIEQATAHVQQFSYHNDKITIVFHHNSVNQLLLENGYTIWGQKRPTVIVWLAMADDNGRQLIGVDNLPESFQGMQQVAEELGISLVVPLLDLTDRNQVSVSDIWGQFPSVLMHASERYGADAILVGQLQKDWGRWQGRWQLIVDDYQTVNPIAGEDLTTIFQNGVQFSVAQLKSFFGFQQTQQQTTALRVNVNNIYSVADFGRAEAYLNSIDQIEAVTVLEINQQNVTFSVTPRGGIDKNMLSHVIGRDRRMVLMQERPHKQPNARHSKDDLAYRWVP